MIAPTVTLGKLTDIQTGKLDANASTVDGTFPFFTCARNPLKIDKWRYDLDAVLVAGNGDLNVKHYRGKFEAYQRTYILSVSDPSLLDTRYLYHFMETYLAILREQSIGGIIKYIKMGMLTEAPIPLPPLDEQKRIAAILDQADELRHLRARALNTLKSLTQAIFHEMFGDPFSSGKTNQVVDLESLTTRITYGFTSPMSHHETGIPILTAKSVREGFIDYSTCSYAVQKEFDALSAKSKPEKGDILITKDGTIGRYAVFNDDFPVAINQSVALVKPDQQRVVPDFLAAYFGSAGVQARFQAMKKGNALPHLQITELAKFPIFSPPLADQMALKACVQKVTEMAIPIERSARELETLFTSLQHRAFRGEL